MWRFVIYSFALLLPGVIITVAVAWTCVFRVDAFSAIEKTASFRADGYTWWVSVRETPGAARIASMRWFDSSPHVNLKPAPSDLLPGWTGFSESSTEFLSGNNGAEARYADGRGWPFIAMWGEIEPHHRPWASAAGSYSNVLPLAPAWLGLAGDTLIYSTAAWTLLALPVLLFRRVLRRHRRIAHGLCPICAYPVGVSPRCTECGKSLPARAVSNKRTVA